MISYLWTAALLRWCLADLLGRYLGTFESTAPPALPCLGVVRARITEWLTILSDSPTQTIPFSRLRSSCVTPCRDFAVDAYFFGVGVLLVLTSVSGAPTFIKSYFGFMARDIGAGLCIVFSGFITTNAFQIGKYSTWVAIVAFVVGPVLMLSPLLIYCCSWESPGAGATASEKAPLIGAGKDTEAPATTVAGDNAIPEEAFGAE